MQINYERVKEIDKLKSENEDVKRIQGCAKQEISYEVKDIFDNEVKNLERRKRERKN